MEQHREADDFAKLITANADLLMPLERNELVLGLAYALHDLLDAGGLLPVTLAITAGCLNALAEKYLAAARSAVTKSRLLAEPAQVGDQNL